ncbi:MAG: autotransporter-associated beta strand repeat-containing protein, partial [Planctomycetaceae bacterium]|nr:autotransporter-associated beta strand repeat-containing protein [Planctomycetaceae bacterium]
DGTLDISGVTSNTKIQELKSSSTSGSVNLGDKELDVAKGNFSGVVKGINGTLTKTSDETLTLSGTNTYSGATNINAGTLELTDSGSIANSESVTVKGVFDVSGVTTNTSVQDLQGTGSVKLGSKELKVAEGNFSGIVEGNNGTLTKTSAETLTLSGTNTYTGATNINGGKLVLNSNGTIASSAVNVNSGTELNVVGDKTLNNLNSAGTVAFDNALILAGNNGTTISGLNGNGVVTKTGTGTTTLLNNTVGNFVQNTGIVNLNGTLTGNYTQLSDGATLNPSGNSTISGNANLSGNVDILEDRKLNVGGDLTFKSGSVL